MAAWDTAKRSGLLATVKFHWDKTGSNVILECRFPVCKSHTLKLVSSNMTTHLHMLSSQSARHWWQQKRCQNRSFDIKAIFCWWFFVALPCAQSSQLQWLWFFNCIWFWASGARLTAESKLSITWESYPTFLILPLSCRNWLSSSSHWRHPEVLTKHRTATRQTWFGILAGLGPTFHQSSALTHRCNGSGWTGQKNSHSWDQCRASRMGPCLRRSNAWLKG